ncbi:oligoendopeptidase F [Cytobacillus firmus]|nr:oligoendopeptidase F [Cytobacillus firmus]
MTYTYKNRDEVPEKDKWIFQDIYPIIDEWERDYKWIETKEEELKNFDGSIHNGETLYNYLSIDEEVYTKLDFIYAYGMLQADVDTRDSTAQTLVDRATQLSVKINAATSFFMPFLLNLEESVINEYINQEPRLEYFKKSLFKSYRFKNHVLSKEEEDIISNLGEAISAPLRTFKMINDADIKFGRVTNANGERVELTRGLYSKLIKDKDRNRRREAYKAFFKPYLQLKNSIATTLSSNIKNNVTLSKIRRYPSALEKGLFDDVVPIEVYENLISATKADISPLHQYLAARKEKLGLEELRQYDLSVPIVEGVKLEIPYNEAYETVLKALEPLGSNYIDNLKTFKDSRYVDVYETPGKRSGAYSLGIYGTHPFILLNYHDDLHSMFTLAHELGHAMHSWYSNKHQPRVSGYYSILLAEVASTVNEVLLFNYLLEQETNQKIRKYLLNNFIDQFRGTFFSQVMLAEFEKITHEYVENGKTLNVKEFNQIYETLFKQYNGNEVVLDEEVQFGWARVPHFYRPFYVYKYATGFASAIYIADQLINSSDSSALTTYLEFLKSGSSDYPLELLKKTGVDLTKPEPINNALKRFEQLTNEFISLQ